MVILMQCSKNIFEIKIIFWKDVIDIKQMESLVKT